MWALKAALSRESSLFCFITAVYEEVSEWHQFCPERLYYFVLLPVFMAQNNLISPVFSKHFVHLLPDWGVSLKYVKLNFFLKGCWVTLLEFKQLLGLWLTIHFCDSAGKYMQMMNILKPIAFDVIHCVSQLFDYYLYAVYTFFGRNDMVEQFCICLMLLRSFVPRMWCTHHIPRRKSFIPIWSPPHTK